MSQNIKLVTIDGNIGSGKSELLKNLKKKYGNYDHIVFASEPVEEWEKIRDKKTNMSVLEHFYNNQQEYSFSFQMMAFISRLSILRNIVRDNSDKSIIIITERNLFTDKYVFAKMLYDEGKINDINYQIYLEWFDEFAKDFPIDYCIYIKTNPCICKQRISKRSRKGEESIRLSYLVTCDSYHEEYMKNLQIMNTKCIVFDGDKDILQNPNVLEDWLQQIDKILNLFTI
jgi:deoxyguanosine kinase